jgi:chromate reductase, NAD(P)H dehydrogenase (quinone)
MRTLKIAVIVGSNRRDSINRKLAQALTRLGGQSLAFTFVQIDDLPLYNQDLEAPLPPGVARFKAEIAGADGVLFVTPEHNRSLPAVLKNAIDWGARPYGQSVWSGKVVATTGTSPGAIGTALAQQHLRQILGGFLGALVMPAETFIAFKPDLINESGSVTDESTRVFLQAFIDQFAALVRRFASAAEPVREAAA